ncbi:unnamed protein product [Arctogadus glacialis]
METRGEETGETRIHGWRDGKKSFTCHDASGCGVLRSTACLSDDVPSGSGTVHTAKRPSGCGGPSAVPLLFRWMRASLGSGGATASLCFSLHLLLSSRGHRSLVSQPLSPSVSSN